MENRAIRPGNDLLGDGMIFKHNEEKQIKMKRSVLVACILAIHFAALSVKADPGQGVNHNCIYVISMTDNIFYFKSDKYIDGAKVEVYSHETGEKVMSQVVAEKRTSIDLSAQVPGDYIILITKGGFKRKYVFHKDAA